MLLDIQGFGFTIYDPEIATDDLYDDNGKNLFLCWQHIFLWDQEIP